MPVKHWSSAGLLLTDGCNAACASCYLCCGPARGDVMPVESAVRAWRELEDASPHGCRVHLAGGEPLLDAERVLAVLQSADEAGCAPAEMVETNGFWGDDELAARDMLGRLARTSVCEMAISADPFHQEFVGIDTVRRAVELGREILGPRRVRVRWQDWLQIGCDVRQMDDDERRGLFAAWIGAGRDRLHGRAVERLASLLPRRPWTMFGENPCRPSLLRGKHVHVGPTGWVYPGTCAGIIVGRAFGEATLGDLWSWLDEDYAGRPIVGRLAELGPLGLVDLACEVGWTPDEAGYASKCHFCWDLRRALARSDQFDELGPAWVYGL